ncbi:hypothetical protein Acr_13g0006820 [Actinidia rufa]|uniref:Uncharacterized protein n=1 Tax=Actinidia rufa TaxID=165716 RepID=A0A7J0FKQ4_9ERIC|nr:hypothetical protein Acr_13g0006820 [Actinidia rufa]
MSYLVLMEVHWKEIGILTSLASGARQAEERRLVGGLFAPSLGPQLSPRAGFEPPKRLSLPQVSYWGGPRLAGPQVLDTTILVSKLTGLRAGSVHSRSVLNALLNRYGLHALPYSVQGDQVKLR